MVDGAAVALAREQEAEHDDQHETAEGDDRRRTPGWRRQQQRGWPAPWQPPPPALACARRYSDLVLCSHPVTG